MSLGIPNFTTEMLKTPEGLSELNRIFNLINDNVVGNTTNVRVFNGFGSPENVIAAGIGSLFQRFDGSVGTTIYIKESGTLATGWVAIAQLGTPVSLADGGTGAVLVDPGEDSIFLWDDSAGTVVFRTSKNIQIFTSDDTFTAPVGVTKVYLTMVGAGGGGAGADGLGQAGGGGGGETVINKPYTVIPGNSYSIQVGVGGTGGAGGVPAGNGGTGEDTIFDTGGTSVIADGGGGGGGGGSGTAGSGGGTSIDASGTTPGGENDHIGGLGGAGVNGGAGGGTLFGIGGATATAGTANTGVGGGAGGEGGAGRPGGSGIVIVAY